MIKTKKTALSDRRFSNYKSFLEEIKKRIRSTQIKAAISVNEDLIKLYWGIGKDLAEKQIAEEWGTKLMERFAKDLQKEFPGMEGFSRSNIFYMRSFYLAYEKVQQLAGQLENLPIFHIPWWHNVILITRLKDNNQRLWYAQQIVENGWSRASLERWIDSGLYRRQGKAITNFKYTLPTPQSDLAQQTLKNPYVFDILTFSKQAKEKEIEDGLISHIQQFLVELGEGFAFVGRQVHLNIDDKDYYIDALFFHLKLRCYVVVELKAREFEIADTAQINFYLSAVDDLLKHPSDQPTIGILLYHTPKKQRKITVEYALRNLKSPIGISTIRTKLVKSLPKQLEGSLPSVRELEEELRTIEQEKAKK